MVNKLPLYELFLNIPFQKQFFSVIKKILFFYKYRFRTYFKSNKNVRLDEIYWISPKKIKYHTNYLKNQKNKPYFGTRIFPENMRGEILDGGWDISDFVIEEFNIYKAIKERIIEKKDWKDTNFYKGFLYDIKNRTFFDNKIYWNITDEQSLISRCKIIDKLILDIKENGYMLSIKKLNDLEVDEIDVNIGRDGRYLFQNGRHRLSIAKILKIDKVSVMIFVRHKKWEEMRIYLYQYSKKLPKGLFLTPLIHPDLNHIKYNEEIHEILEKIKNNISNSYSNILDINPIIGYTCHKFEEYGFNCSVYENDETLVKIISILKNYEEKKFTVTDNLNSDDLVKIDPHIIFYLFTKKDNFKENILLNAAHFCPNLKEIYLQYINIEDKNYVTQLIYEVIKLTQFNTSSKIYDHNNNCVYKIQK
jgi:hypothetical protein